MFVKKNYSDFKWCIDNDWQVYIKPVGARFKIAIRKGGISSCGKDYYYNKETGETFTSEENLGSVMYKKQEEAESKIWEVYSYLKKRYEKI
jgi:hypothetical protein